MTLLEFLEYVKAGGGILAPVFAIMFWFERDERKDAQAELKQLTRETVTSMVELKSLVGQIVTIFKINGNQ